MLSTNELNNLIDDCLTIIGEYGFISRWTRIEGYHALGKRIIDEESKLAIPELIRVVSKGLGCSQRTIYYAIKFVRKYPEISSVPEGKSITWHRLCNLYLLESEKEKELAEHEHVFEIRCKICKKLKENL